MRAPALALLAALGLAAGCSADPTLVPVRMRLTGVFTAPLAEFVTRAVPTYEAIFSRAGDANAPLADGGYDPASEHRRLVGASAAFAAPQPQSIEFTVYLPVETYASARVAVHMNVLCSSSPGAPLDVVVAAGSTVLPTGFTPRLGMDNTVDMTVRFPGTAPCPP